MILVAGLSPAWQKIMRFGAVQLGSVNRAAEVHHCASGKVLNVATAVTLLGAPCEALSVAGGSRGNAMQMDFAALGCIAHWVPTTSPTRTCITLLEETTGRTTELVENAPPLTDSELTEYRTAFSQLARRAELVVISGSQPQGTPPTLNRESLTGFSVPVILDTRGAELLAALECRPLLVKPNRHELADTFSRPLDNDIDVMSAMQELRAHGATWVLVTDGANPTWIAGPEGLFRVIPPDIQVVNPIGSGDCLTAAVACAVTRGRPMMESIRFGMAAAADNAAQLLPARIDYDRVSRLVERVEVERI